MVQEGEGAHLQRTLVSVTQSNTFTGTSMTGTYHGSTFTHMDSIGCHVMFEGKDFNGVSMDQVKAANGCPKSSIDTQRDGVFTRAVLFDATLLPGKATPQGWVEPGVSIHREDLRSLEKIEGVKVSAGDIVILYTGRWKREAALGVTRDRAGYQADVAYFLKEREVAFLGHDSTQDVHSGFPPIIGSPLHKLALVGLGVILFDNLDLERAMEVVRRLKRYEFLFTVAPLRVKKASARR